MAGFHRFRHTVASRMFAAGRNVCRFSGGWDTIRRASRSTPVSICSTRIWAGLSSSSVSTRGQAPARKSRRPRPTPKSRKLAVSRGNTQQRTPAATLRIPRAVSLLGMGCETGVRLDQAAGAVIDRAPGAAQATFSASTLRGCRSPSFMIWSPTATCGG